jgi:hypothetical protein
MIARRGGITPSESDMPMRRAARLFLLRVKSEGGYDAPISLVSSIGLPAADQGRYDELFEPG